MRALLIAVLILIMTSCASTKYVEVPVETIKTEYVTNYERDSIFVHDSIDRFTKGDTVFQTVYKYRYKQINKTDTVIKTDTIPKIITVEKVEVKEVNKIKWWLNLLMYSGIAALAMLIFSIYKKIRTIVR